MAKNPERKSEDGIVVNDNFIAVIDGSTSKSSQRYSRRYSNGQYAMLLVSKAIKNLAPDASCHQFCIAVTRLFYETLCGHSLLAGGPLRKHKPMPDPVDRIAASAVIFSRRRREVWMVGDCLCLINGTLIENPKPFEAELAARRAAIISQSPHPEDFLTNDTARAAILPEMMDVMRRQQNVDYAVIDGSPIAEKHVRILPLDFQPKEIVLATDGYPFLCPTLEASEQALAQQLRDDPLNIRTYQATKGCMKGNTSFDDRAYIRFNV